jgi:ligand-binding SRPBCC domain-containing protein
MSEITHVQPSVSFVDEQRIGPYYLWHHEHQFREIAEGIEMSDIIHYALPFSPWSEWIHPLWIRPQLEHIFDYRRKITTDLFG